MIISPLRVGLFSSVESSMLKRMSASFLEVGIQAHAYSEYESADWRKARTAGRVSITLARLRSAILYPARTLFSAKKCDILVATTNPFFLPHFLVLTRPFHKRPVVALMWDLFPDAMVAAGYHLPTLLRNGLARANSWLFRNANALVFIGDAMSEHSSSVYGTPRCKVTIPIGAPVGEFAGATNDPTGTYASLPGWCMDRILLSYIGNMGAMHDWQTLSQLIIRLEKAGATDRLAVVVACSGANAESLKQSLKDVSPNFLKVVPPLDESTWIWLQKRTNIAVATLRPEAATVSLPSKIFSGLASGAALLAIGPTNSDLARLVINHECGVVVQPGDIEQAFNVVMGYANDKRLLQRHRSAAFDAAKNCFDMRVLANDWLTLFQRVI